MEGNEIPKGWPLGLGNINSVVVDSSLVPQPPRRCSSFSSFSSSNLDTESTASFFPDQSVPLGRLIGIRAGGDGNYKVEKQNNSINQESSADIHINIIDEAQDSESDHPRICTPLLQHVISRIFRTTTH